MRHFVFGSFLFLVTLSATAQNLRVGDGSLKLIEEGDRWRVFEHVDPSARIPTKGTLAVFRARDVDELEGRLPATEIQDIHDDLAAGGAPSDLIVIHLEAAWERAVLAPAILEKSAKDCSGWQDPKTYSDSWRINRNESSDFLQINQGPFSGSIVGSLSLDATIDASAVYQVKKFLCVPYKFRLVQVDVTGEADIDASLSLVAELGYTTKWDWDHTLFTIDLGSYIVWLGPVPVYLDFSLPVDFGIETQVNVAGRAELRAEIHGNVIFDVNCQSTDCHGNTVFEGYSDLAEPTYEITLDAKAKVWARAEVQMEIYDDDIAVVAVGATGYIQAHLFGYVGNRCGDADGDGYGDTLEDLLLDVDAGYEVIARADGLLSEAEWTLFDRLWHLRFWDLYDDADGNITDLMATGPAQSEGGTNVIYDVTTRPCYPFDEPLTVLWSGLSAGSGTLTPRTGHLQVSTLPPTVGQYTQVFTGLHDAHGRAFGNSITKSLTVTGKSGSAFMDVSLGPTQMECVTFPSQGSLTGLDIEVEFDNVYGFNSTLASDMILRLYDPDGTCLKIGGLGGSYGCDGPAWDASWNSAVDGSYHDLKIGLAARGLRGDGGWQLCISNGNTYGSMARYKVAIKPVSMLLLFSDDFEDGTASAWEMIQ